MPDTVRLETIAMSPPQKVIGDRIVALIGELDALKPGDARLEGYPVDDQPGEWITVSPLKPKVLPGLNNSDDIQFPYGILYNTHILKKEDAVEYKAVWQWAVWKKFNQVRIGLPSEIGCELVTNVKFDDIESKTQWERRNKDINVMVVTVSMRMPTGY